MSAPFWNNLEHHVERISFWMAHPRVRAHINREVSGEESVWPITWLQRTLRDELPAAKALSIGSGAGSLERDLVLQGIVGEVTGVDITEAPLKEAERLAEEAGVSDRVRYLRADAREVLRNSRDLDAIFFHASLHHFDRLDELMQLLHDALRPGGFLYLDEYVGPSMHQWNLLRLLPANLVYRILPAKARRTKVIRTPRNPEDPTEAIASAEILPAVERRFRVEQRRDYGGNLVSLIYSNLHHDDAAALDVAVRRMLTWESLVRRWQPSFHTVLIARRER